MIKSDREIIHIHDYVGKFAEDKDVAKDLRINTLWPLVKSGKEVELDFENVDDATQSFVHALLSELIRETHGEVLDLFYFKNCSETVKNIVNMVVNYMLEG